MKVALIDASVTPMSRRQAGTKKLPRTFMPSIDIMKAFTYCKREHMDARILLYREEMEDLGSYSVVLVSRENPATPLPPSIESLILAHKANVCDKTFFESLYDGHAGMDMCVMSRSSPLPLASGKGLGAVVDACPGDIDAYGEMLFVRGRMDLIGSRGKERLIDMAYGRIMLEDGSWMAPERMVQYAGTNRLEIADFRPSAIPDTILGEFIERAVARKIKLQFRHPLMLDEIGPLAMGASHGLKVINDLPLGGYRPEHKLKVLELADSVGRGKISLVYEDIGKGAVGEGEHMKAIRDYVLSMYACDANGFRFRSKLSDDARTSRFSPLYIAVNKWRVGGPACHMMTLGGYISWLATKEVPGAQKAADGLLEQFARFSEAYPSVREMMDVYTVDAAGKGACIYKEALRWKSPMPS